MSYLLFVTIYRADLHKIALMSAFEMCHKIYLFELLCDKAFVPFSTLTRNRGKCFLTVNYTALTRLVLVLRNKETRILSDVKLLFQE